MSDLRNTALLVLALLVSAGSMPTAHADESALKLKAELESGLNDLELSSGRLKELTTDQARQAVKEYGEKLQGIRETLRLANKGFTDYYQRRLDVEKDAMVACHRETECVQTVNSRYTELLSRQKEEREILNQLDLKIPDTERVIAQQIAIATSFKAFLTLAEGLERTSDFHFIGSTLENERQTISFELEYAYYYPEKRYEYSGVKVSAIGRQAEIQYLQNNHVKNVRFELASDVRELIEIPGLIERSETWSDWAMGEKFISGLSFESLKDVLLKGERLNCRVFTLPEASERVKPYRINYGLVFISEVSLTVR